MNHLLCGLAANEALPPDLVDRLIAVADADVAHVLAGRPDLRHEQAVALVARDGESAQRLAYEGRLTATDVDPVTHPDAALALLDRREGRPEWARLLATHPRVAYRESLAACAGLPSDVVETLAADPDVRVVAELALWTTADAAAALARHPHAEVRRAVAANEATPPAVLAALITGEGLPPARWCLVCDRERTPFVHPTRCPRRDCDLRPGDSCDGSHDSTAHLMRQMALRNPATPTQAVVGFAAHPSIQLRWDLAARPDLPPEVSERLAADPARVVRAALAENPAIGGPLIRAMADDPDQDVRRALARHPDVPLDVLRRLAATTRLGATLLPQISAASPQEVEELAASPDPEVRMLLARRRDLPAGIRDTLAADPDAKVAKSVAPHPGLSEAALRATVGRHGAQVVAAVATNPDATPALLEELTGHRPPVQKAFRAVARHARATAPALLACLADRQARPLAAGRPALAPPVVVELLTDDDPRTVEAAAANPSLPLAVMAELLDRA
ncbi:hypothetical protein [Streptomyces liangshanensis]|uniref:Leucine rich repeat variant n=1 Tax=Streptomyces liangshanensis TaxID=2717324 RepID=A0A6G9H7C4_9ACTN|nr:hypothetical protein [Streptomyces liangshanensis]QIQ06390.1 hypothetical protein HA039_32400 [Streptomyces liangshanensis]